MKRSITFTLIFIILYIWNTSFAFSYSKTLENQVIADAETSQFLADLSSIITTDISLEDLKLYVIINNTINAAATTKNRIFINTGIFTKSNNPESLLAVLTHEMGHITQNHLTRLQARLDDSALASLAGAALGIGALVIASAQSATTPDSIGALAAVPSFMLDLTSKNLIQYTRSEESLADQFVIDSFLKHKISLTEYVEFLKELSKQDVLYESLNDWQLDHPKTSDRLAEVESKLKEIDKNTLKKLPDNIQLSYKMVRAKIIGFLNDTKTVKAIYSSLNEIDTPYYYYALALSNMVAKNYDEGIKNIDYILENYLDKYPNLKKGYILEAKAEILSNKGDYNSAIELYRQAISDLKGISTLYIIEMSYANNLIYSNDKSNIEEAIKLLKKIIFLNSDLIQIYKYLSIAYGKLEDIGLAHYYLAKFYEKIGNREEMINNIEKSEEKLNKDSREYKDLIQMKNNLK